MGSFPARPNRGVVRRAPRTRAVRRAFRVADGAGPCSVLRAPGCPRCRRERPATAHPCGTGSPTREAWTLLGAFGPRAKAVGYPSSKGLAVPRKGHTLIPDGEYGFVRGAGGEAGRLAASRRRARTGSSPRSTTRIAAAPRSSSARSTRPTRASGRCSPRRPTRASGRCSPRARARSASTCTPEPGRSARHRPRGRSCSPRSAGAGTARSRAAPRSRRRRGRRCPVVRADRDQVLLLA